MSALFSPGHSGPGIPTGCAPGCKTGGNILRFSQSILPLARQLHAAEQFDLVHHVTYATWRVASPLWQLGIPLVFGPVGGNEQFPARLLPILSPSAAAFELARMVSNAVSRFSPAVRNCLRRAAHIFVANAETEQLVNAVRGSGNGVSRLLAAFYSDAQTAAFARFAPDKKLDGPLRLFAAGNMEGRKGVALALAALARAKAAGVKFHYRLGANGPEVAHLKERTARLGLTAEVEFTEGLQGEAYQRELGRTHVFLLPSLRESAGLTMMEAMLAGAVPVVADGGGPGFIVTPECGFNPAWAAAAGWWRNWRKPLSPLTATGKSFQKRAGRPRKELPRISRRRITGKRLTRFIHPWAMPAQATGLGRHEAARPLLADHHVGPGVHPPD